MGETRDAQGPGDTPSGPPAVWAGRIADALISERERWVLWLPAGLGAGIGAYFALSVEPPAWIGAVAVLLAAVLVWRTAGRPAGRAVAWGLLALAAGFAAAQVRTALVAAPVLAERTRPVGVEGQVVAVEPVGRGRRIVLDDLAIRGLGDGPAPRRVRVRIGAEPPLEPGMRVSLRAVLGPPPPPVSPGAYDFQRRAYFEGLGAVGFAMGRPRVLADTSHAGGWFPAHGVAALRLSLGERVMRGLPGPDGAVARALMTGERGAIPGPILDAMRDSGMAHLLAISGLHIGLVAGILFVGVRALLALVAPLALRFPIKKWAAAAALAGALAYALIAGATVPTQRAFLMIGLVLLAVLLDRRGLSIRSVAWAALIILLVQPESLLGASFQLSFAAVTALIAAYEVARERRRAWRRDAPSWGRGVVLYVGGVALSTLIAGTATAPFAIFHFNRLAAYGLAANLGAVPITALWVMPWAVVAFLLMPFGLESLALVPMGWGIAGIVRIAETVAAWPGAVTLIPAMPTWGLVVLAAGGLWLCLWRGRWRLWGVPVIAAGLATLVLARPPDVLIDDQGKLAAVRMGNDGLAVSSLSLGRFDRETWLRRAGQEEDPVPWPENGAGVAGSGDGSANGGEGGGARLACDGLGCIYRADGHVVALVRREGALAEDCRAADVVVAAVPVRSRCPSARLVVDRFDLWRFGAHALWLEPDRVRVESVNGVRGTRPWVAWPRGG